MTQDARKFLISSDYPMDMVVWAKSGEVVIQQGTTVTITIPHGLPFTPLFFGLYSLDDGNTWVSIDTETEGPGGAALYPLANSQNVEIDINSRANTTMKYKLWAYAPSDSSATLSVATTENIFHINSDVSYLKLAKNGIWQAEIGDDITVYKHGLGYNPWAIMWFEYVDGTIRLPLFVYSEDTSKESNRYVTIDNDAVKATFSSLEIGLMGQLQKIHYRIYADAIGEANA